MEIHNVFQAIIFQVIFPQGFQNHSWFAPEEYVVEVKWKFY